MKKNKWKWTRQWKRSLLAWLDAPLRPSCVHLYNISSSGHCAQKCNIKFHFGCSTRGVRLFGRNERRACDRMVSHLINHLILPVRKLTLHLFRFISCISAPFFQRRQEEKSQQPVDVHLWDPPGIERSHRGEETAESSRWPALSNRFCIRSVSCGCVLTRQAGGQLITALPWHCVSLSSASVLWASLSVPACFITGLLVGLICATVTVSGPQPPRFAFDRGQRGHTDRKEGWLGFKKK